MQTVKAITASNKFSLIEQTIGFPATLVNIINIKYRKEILVRTTKLWLDISKIYLLVHGCTCMA